MWIRQGFQIRLCLFFALCSILVFTFKMQVGGIASTFDFCSLSLEAIALRYSCWRAWGWIDIDGLLPPMAAITPYMPAAMGRGWRNVVCRHALPLPASLLSSISKLCRMSILAMHVLTCCRSFIILSNFSAKKIPARPCCPSPPHSTCLLGNVVNQSSQLSYCVVLRISVW